MTRPGAVGEAGYGEEAARQLHRLDRSTHVLAVADPLADGRDVSLRHPGGHVSSAWLPGREPDAASSRANYFSFILELIGTVTGDADADSAAAWGVGPLPPAWHRPAIEPQEGRWPTDGPTPGAKQRWDRADVSAPKASVLFCRARRVGRPCVRVASLSTPLTSVSPTRCEPNELECYSCHEPYKISC